MGRRPAPLKLKLAKGRGRSRDSGGRLLPPPPAFARYAPEPPDSLSASARAHWDLVMPELARLDLLTPAHAGVLTAACEVWALAEEALEHVREEGQGQVTNSPQGQRRNPWLVSYQALIKEYRALAGELGLSPASESKLGIKAPAPLGDNPFAWPPTRARG